MKTKLILLAFATLCFKVSAQSIKPLTEPSELISITKLELGLHGVGAGYEIPISKKFTVNLSAGLGGGYSIYGNDFRSTWVINDPVAYFRSEVKYIYNREKRYGKGKAMLNNSGNYVAFQTKYTTARISGRKDFDPLNKTLLNEMHWGIQRPLGQRFIFNTHIGLGFGADFDSGSKTIYPAAGLQFAYIISKNRKSF
ncbi:hypothetical protein [Pontibacter sp. H249]|uniref:hypothetical protein n=1 Tax=Pontibacter sp. H249 TaxID=3133420 RepID=UPI0030BF64F5